jgi:hypothetical protein
MHETRRNPNKQGEKVMVLKEWAERRRMEPKIGVEPTTC